METLLNLNAIAEFIRLSHIGADVPKNNTALTALNEKVHKELEVYQTVCGLLQGKDWDHEKELTDLIYNSGAVIAFTKDFIYDGDIALLIKSSTASDGFVVIKLNEDGTWRYSSDVTNPTGIIGTQKNHTNPLARSADALAISKIANMLAVRWVNLRVQQIHDRIVDILDDNDKVIVQTAMSLPSSLVPEKATTPEGIYKLIAPAFGDDRVCSTKVNNFATWLSCGVKTDLPKRQIISLYLEWLAA